MKTRLVTRHGVSPLFPIAAALMLSCGTAQAAVGLRVLLQEWNPAQPLRQSVKPLVNEPGAVSDVLLKVWREARPKLCKALSDEMGKGGAAGGYTLYRIDCVLDETPAFTVASAGANALTATLAIGGYVAATSTTPDYIDRTFDPRFSIALKSRLVLSLSVQPNHAQTLRVDKAAFTLSDATLDSHGLTGDIVKFVVSDLVPFFHGPNYRHLAERAINGVAADVAGRFNIAFAPINERLRGPAEVVRVGVWGRPDAITVAFAPREMTPPGGGTMAGVFRWDGGQTPGRCDGLSISASVQTGPAPLRDPNGRFEPADAPHKKVGEFRLEAAGPGGECRYRLSGLSAGWQNELMLKSGLEAVASADLRKSSLRYTLKGDGWDGHRVTPQPSAQGNYVILVSPAAGAVLDPEVAVNRRVPAVGVARPNPGDRFGSESMKSGVTPPPMSAQVPVVTPATSAKVQPKTWTTVPSTAPAQRPTAVAGSAFGTAAPMATSIRARQGAATRLNPQPLPPEPPPERGVTTLR